MSVDEKFICKFFCIMKTCSEISKINILFGNLYDKNSVYNQTLKPYDTSCFLYINGLVLFNVRNTCTCCNLRSIILVNCLKLIFIIFGRGHNVVYWMWRRSLSASNELNYANKKKCRNCSAWIAVNWLFWDWILYLERNITY